MTTNTNSQWLDYFVSKCDGQIQNANSQAGSKISLAKGESSLGLRDPLRMSMSTMCRPFEGMLLKRARRSIVTSAADWPDPITATRNGREIVENLSKIWDIDVAYCELWRIWGCLMTGDRNAGIRGDPPGEITMFPNFHVNAKLNLQRIIRTYWFLPQFLLQ